MVISVTFALVRPLRQPGVVLYILAYPQNPSIHRHDAGLKGPSSPRSLGGDRHLAWSRSGLPLIGQVEILTVAFISSSLRDAVVFLSLDRRPAGAADRDPGKARTEKV